MIQNQSGNTVVGDLVGGNKSMTVFSLGSPDSIGELKALYEKLKVTGGKGDLSNGNFCEQLEHYFTAKTRGDVRGLEAKLVESNREDQVDLATELKEKATKAVMRYQSSKTAQRIYTIILDEIHASFSLSVTPAIQSGETRMEVDQRISMLLQGTQQMLGENVLEISKKDLLALLYFLGGNCHIRWDKC